MTSKKHYLRPVPEEDIPPSGPSFRLGCVGWAAFIFVTLVAVIGFFVYVEKPSGNAIYFFGPLIVLWLVLLVLVVISYTKRKAKLVGEDVLRDVLNFDIGANHYDVGITAICRPDETGPGCASTLLVFMQNYSARPRHISIRLPKHAVLGWLSGQTVDLQIGPGQCVVYRAGFLVSANANVKTYSLTGRVKTRLPNGMGVRMIKKSPKEARLMIFRPRVLDIILDVNQAPCEAGSQAIAEPQYLVIYSTSMVEPNFDLLQNVSNMPPQESLPV